VVVVIVPTMCKESISLKVEWHPDTDEISWAANVWVDGKLVKNPIHSMMRKLCELRQQSERQAHRRQRHRQKLFERGLKRSSNVGTPFTAPGDTSKLRECTAQICSAIAAASTDNADDGDGDGDGDDHRQRRQPRA
jgi:hypothetical protein